MGIVHKQVKKEEKKLAIEKKKCIVCGGKPEYCIRGAPQNSYCRKCALDHFKFLNYLEKL